MDQIYQFKLMLKSWFSLALTNLNKVLCIFGVHRSTWGIPVSEKWEFDGEYYVRDVITGTCQCCGFMRKKYLD